MKFYVYAYLRSKNSNTAKAGTPYYIGKGFSKRAFSKHGKLSLPPNKNNIVFLEMNLSEVGALALERRYILWYGRKNINTGILLNRTDGGDGISGAKIKRTAEHQRKLNATNVGRKLSPEAKHKLYLANIGKIQSEETKTKRRLKLIGIKRSPETKALMSKNFMGKAAKRWLVATIENKFFDVINLFQFLKDYKLPLTGNTAVGRNQLIKLKETSRCMWYVANIPLEVGPVKIKSSTKDISYNEYIELALKYNLIPST